MKFEYDSWNRIKKMTYPDGDVVNYSYDAAGERAFKMNGITAKAWDCLGTLRPILCASKADTPPGISGEGEAAEATTPIVGSTTVPAKPKCLNLNILSATPITLLPPPAIYFYHPDHLSSASWITDIAGTAIQHLQYLPFGETRVDQRTTSWNSRYSFSAKEKDEESGYGYFGARYYDSDLSIWLSVDPMASKYPSTSPFAYCNNNPLRISDPNGKEWEIDGIKYQPGQTCPDDVAQNTKDKWNTMNKMYNTAGGKKVIDDLNGSDVRYGVSSEKVSNGKGGYQSNPDGTGGTIYLNGNNTNLNALSHESFHAYQDYNGQGGASLFNELEANLFTFSVTGANHLTNNESSGTEWNKNVNSLLLSFDNSSFEYLLDNFTSCVGGLDKTAYEKYPRQRSNQTKNLIQDFYPLQQGAVIRPQ